VTTQLARGNRETTPHICSSRAQAKFPADQTNRTDDSDSLVRTLVHTFTAVPLQRVAERCYQW